MHTIKSFESSLVDKVMQIDDGDGEINTSNLINLKKSHDDKNT